MVLPLHQPTTFYTEVVNFLTVFCNPIRRPAQMTSQAGAQPICCRTCTASSWLPYRWCATAKLIQLARLPGRSCSSWWRASANPGRSRSWICGVSAKEGSH